MHMAKGDYGYISGKKKSTLLWLLLMIIIGLAIFGLGLLLNKLEGKNIFTVLAILMVLPAAKFLTTYIVLFPYRTVSREKYDKLLTVLNSEEEGTKVYADMVITSPEKVMNLDFLVVKGHKVLAVTGKEKQDISYIQNYLKKGVTNWARGCSVRIYDADAFEKFLREVKKIESTVWEGKEFEEVTAYLNSLIIQ